MKTAVQLQGPLAKYARGPAFFEWETTAETCMIKELLLQLGIPASSVAFVSVDGSKQNSEYLLKGGERVVVYPRVAGG
jgi:hypothetical protein